MFTSRHSLTFQHPSETIWFSLTCFSMVLLYCPAGGSKRHCWDCKQQRPYSSCSMAKQQTAATRMCACATLCSLNRERQVWAHANNTRLLIWRPALPALIATSAPSPGSRGLTHGLALREAITIGSKEPPPPSRPPPPPSPNHPSIQPSPPTNAHKC